MNKFLLMCGMLGCAGLLMAEPVAERLFDLEALANQATHVVEIDAADFAAVTGTNTSYTSSIPVSAKALVYLGHMRLSQAFDTANTNVTGSVSVKVGDAGDDDRFLTATELASDGTEIWGKWGNTAWNSGITNNVTFAYSPVCYTVGTNINFIFTPNSGEALASNTVGRVKFYFGILNP